MSNTNLKSGEKYLSENVASLLFSKTLFYFLFKKKKIPILNVSTKYTYYT